MGEEVVREGVLQRGFSFVYLQSIHIFPQFRERMNS